AAVVASLSRVQKSAMAFVLAGVTDLRAVDGALEVSGAVDPTTLARRLALPQAGIVADQAPSADRAVGSGPFMLASLRRRERAVQLTAFAAYHAGRPYLDEVVLHWFDTPDGEARRFEIGASQISLRGVTAFAGAEPKFRADTVEGPAAVLVFVGFGNGHPEITGRREVRAALDLALARGGFSTLGARCAGSPRSRAPSPSFARTPWRGRRRCWCSSASATATRRSPGGERCAQNLHTSAWMERMNRSSATRSPAAAAVARRSRSCIGQFCLGGRELCQLPATHVSHGVCSDT
ncbi:MAG TPA: ABC transporter substrate-binding protein, partial [Miltoncostaeales bacterium]|nr:ABC transporter substrate-binding protein [Miltoncostaeales bacterium]